GRLRLEEEIERVMAHRPGVQLASQRRRLELAFHREAVRADRPGIVADLAAAYGVLEHKLARPQALPMGLALTRRGRQRPFRRGRAHAALRRMASEPSPMSP